MQLDPTHQHHSLLSFVISDRTLLIGTRTQLDVDQKTKWLIEYLASRTTKHAKQQLLLLKPGSLLNKLDLINAGKPAP